MNANRLIKKSKYFSDMEERESMALLRCLTGQVKTYYKNESIVNDGDVSEFVYIILSGYARTYVIDIDGNRKIGSDYPKDSIFGLEYSVQKAKNYREYLIALEDTVVLICDSFRFINPCQNRCKRHIDFMKSVFDEYTKQLTLSKRRISFICEGKTQDRVMAFLKSVKSQTRREYFTIPYSRQEMADYLAVERTALSAELSKLRNAKVIDFDKNSFKIIKKDK